MDFIGFESMSPNASYDQARDGWNFANTIYNISSSNNPVYERNCWCADGFYADGGTRIVVERDLVHDVDINEAASEQPGHKSSYVTIRNNVIYNMNAPGLSIGGASGSATGGSDHIVLVNNTLYNDSTKVSGQGEFQIQYFATNNTFENNVVYATQSILVNDYTNSTTNPATLDHNDWFYAPGSGPLPSSGKTHPSPGITTTNASRNRMLSPHLPIRSLWSDSPRRQIWTLP
jgi:hypothetical protein